MAQKKLRNNRTFFLIMSGKYCRSFPSKFGNNVAVEISVSIHKRHV